MESLKLIPQVYFDIIARIVPGATALFTYSIVLQLVSFAITPSSVTPLSKTLLGTNLLSDNSQPVFLRVFLFLGISYTIGQILAPLNKMLFKSITLIWKPSRLMNRVIRSPWQLQKTSQSEAKVNQEAFPYKKDTFTIDSQDNNNGRHTKKGIIQEIFESSRYNEKFLQEEFGGKKSQYDPEYEAHIWIWYDWLRMFQSDAGALTVRIRAEYSM